VSLFTDIIQLFGTSGVPAIVAGSVFFVFELGERFASQRAKDALSEWLLSFDVQKAKALPDGTRELFERIFGERHFSLKCFIRSAAFSLGAMAFIAILMFLVYPKEFVRMANLSFAAPDMPGFVGEFRHFLVWLPWSVFIDYVSLFKTRLILGFLTRIRSRNATVAIAIVAIDYAVYRLLFSIGLEVVSFGALATQMDLDSWVHFMVEDITTFFFVQSIGNGISSWGFIYLPDISIWSIFFWGGFAPSLWMWLYVLALFVTRGFLRSERLVNWLRWFLDVEKNPFRSIGAVAAALAFVASVAIIMVSAEISRISGAA